MPDIEYYILLVEQPIELTLFCVKMSAPGPLNSDFYNMISLEPCVMRL